MVLFCFVQLIQICLTSPETIVLQKNILRFGIHFINDTISMSKPLNIHLNTLKKHETVKNLCLAALIPRENKML